MFEINPEQWVRSAAHVTGQGADLAAGHLSSDHRIQAAQSGWQGASALALNAAMDDWLEMSRALLSRIGDHARGLHQAAVAHAAAEEERARALAQVGVGCDRCR
ncbi:WXG100 family type VII secretion target [Mycobacterium marinum]|uniref:WXG100 family type VII secretion target n=1 Tax=Mycobacterium marinum TaxID=1781 RepID=UPI002359D6B6|nr:WXG100 family type VII secretion target [Mycobacterium marinum]MDC8970692.1 WXG100 family type VII secretion target [Mycobacterium marinum]